MEVALHYRNREELHLLGPAVDVNISPVTEHDELPIVEHPALIDTGATESCIDGNLANAIGLPVVDRRPVSGVHGVSAVNFYLATLTIPILSFTARGLFADVELGGAIPYSTLLGRDFLRRCKMTYDGTEGKIVLQISNQASSD